jgi:hypothetical protein
VVAVAQEQREELSEAGADAGRRGLPKAYKSRIFPLLKSDGPISGLREIATPRPLCVLLSELYISTGLHQ